MEQVVSSWASSALANTNKYVLAEAAHELLVAQFEELEHLELPDGCFDGVSVEITEQQCAPSAVASRDVRLSNALTVFTLAVDRLGRIGNDDDGKEDETEEDDELSSCAGEIEEVISALGEIEWPSWRG